MLTEQYFSLCVIVPVNAGFLKEFVKNEDFIRVLTMSLQIVLSKC